MSFQQDPDDVKRQREKFFGRAVSGVAGFARRFFPSDPRERKRDARITGRDIHLPSPKLASNRTQTRKR